MALDQFELLRIKQLVVPQVVPLLREIRARGQDPRTDAKAMFWDANRRPALNARLSLTEGIDMGEWSLIVDVAMLQL